MSGIWGPPRDPGQQAEALRLSVHVLSEFTFCPRAGLIALGLDPADRGDDFWLRPNLDYQPSYELYELRRAISHALARSVLTGLAFGLTFAGCVYLLREWNLLPLAAGTLLLLFISWTLSRSLAGLSSLLSQWKRIQSLAPREPDPSSVAIQPVVWWEMLRAGFDPVRLPDPLRSDRLHLEGRPWRLLRKGELQIPVFRVEPDEGRRLYPKHGVRASAYCQLIEDAVGAESPYAIALFADSYAGWTIPNTAEARESFRRVLDAALSGLRPDATPGPPESLKLCMGCPLGLPRVYGRGRTETTLFGELVHPRGAIGRDLRLYHSTCGDRFDWVPPHIEAAAIGLRSKVEGGA